jgi:hypothetical protein
LDEHKGTPNNDTTFYPRVINYTAIIFSNEEPQLLNKGLKYNLNHKCKQWISNIAFEAEAAVSILPPKEQEYVRHQIAKNLKKLYQQHNQHHVQTLDYIIYSSNLQEQEMDRLRAVITRSEQWPDSKNNLVVKYSYYKNF